MIKDRHIRLCILLCMLTGLRVNAQTLDSVLFNAKMKTVAGKKMPELLLNMANSFIGSPYKAGTLEASFTEKLTVNLYNFDCWTFVETCIALTLTKENAGDYAYFLKTLQNLRYRNGKIDGYASRIHYFSEWLSQQGKSHVLDDISVKIGGRPLVKTIDFMSQHRTKYPKLISNEVFEKINSIEKRLSQQVLFYIPKSQINDIENSLQNGDIVAITTDIAGLDVSHEGFIIQKNSRAYLLHASSEVHKVVISDVPLGEYLAQHRLQNGIMVARIVKK